MTAMITGAGLLATHAPQALVHAGSAALFNDVAPSEVSRRLVMEDRAVMATQVTIEGTVSAMYDRHRYGEGGSQRHVCIASPKRLGLVAYVPAIRQIS